MSVSSMGGCGFSRRSQQTDPIDDQGIAGQHVEEQDPLEDLGEIEWHLQRDWGAFTTKEGQGEEQAGEQNTHRIEPAEKRNDDGGEAVARRYTRIEMADWSGHFDNAG